MKILTIIFLVLTMYSCSKTETSQQKSTLDSVSVSNEIIDSSKVWVSKNQDFLDKFRTIEVDSSMFAPPKYDEKQIGPSLTTEELQLFPKMLNTDSFIGSLQDFQAYTKFEIDSNTLGLVLRTPGEYAFTALTLFFYDKTTDEILPHYFELADEMGDAGYSENLTSWLIKDGNRLKSFSYQWTKVEKIEPDDPTRESRTDDYYLIELSPQLMDTARVSPAELPKYRHLLSKK